MIKMDEEIAVDIFLESEESEKIFEELQMIVKQAFVSGYRKGKEEKHTVV